MNTLSWIVDGSFSTKLTLALLHFLWQGCAGGILVMVGGWLLRGAAARTRYTLNVTAMFLMAACLPVTFFLLGSSVLDTDRFVSVQDVHGSPAIPLSPAVVPDAANEHLFSDGANAVNSGGSSVAPIPVAELGSLSQDVRSTRVAPTVWPLSLSTTLTANVFPILSRWVAALYLTGVALILGRLLRGVWGGHRLRKMANIVKDPVLLEMVRNQARRLGLKVAPTIAWCEQISIPVVVGIATPMILLPMAVVSGLTPGQLQALLLHELSHIRRYDPIVNLLQRIIEAMVFFHPVVWFVSRRISIERELAADDMVLAAGWDRPLYADALVRMAELAASISGPDVVRRSTALGAAGTNPSQFKLRVLRLLGDSHPPKLDLSRAGILVTFLIVVMGGVLAWSQTDKQEKAAVRSDVANIDDAVPIDTVTSPLPPQKEIAKELTPFQGSWAVTLCDSALKAYGAPQFEAQKWRWTIEGDEIIWRREGGQWKLSLHVDPSKSPGEIDLTYLSGPFKGEKCQGMYEFGGVDGKTLQIAIQDPGAKVNRPKQIEMRGNGQTGLIFLRPTTPIDPEKELAALQGIWTFTNVMTKAWPKPIGIKNDQVNVRRWVVKANEISWIGIDGNEVKASIAIDPQQVPRHIDLTFLSGRSKGQKCKGVYEWSGGGGDLDICVADPGSNADRPKRIFYSGQATYSWITLDRITPPGDPTSPPDGTAAEFEKPVAKELEPFQGIWPMNLCDSEDKMLHAPQKEVFTWRWEVKGNEITWSRSDKQVWHLTFSVDPTKSPKEIDLTYLDGPFKDKTCQGMYEWAGKEQKGLLMSLQDPGAIVPRPKDISMTGGGRTSLIFLDPRESSTPQAPANPKSKKNVESGAVPTEKPVEERTLSDATPPVGQSGTSHRPLVLVGHADFVTGVAFSPDGKRIVSSSRDSTIKVWDAVTGQESLTLKESATKLSDGHVGMVTCVAFSPNGKYLASGGADKMGRVWNAVTGHADSGLFTNGAVMSVAYNSDGTRIATASADNTVRIWDANPEMHEGVHILSMKAQEPLSVAFSPDGKRLAAAGRDMKVRVWDAVTSEELLTANQSDQALCVKFSPDGKRIAIAVGNGVNVCASTDCKTLLHLKGHTQPVVSVAFSPDGARLASAGWDQVVKVWNSITGEELLALKGHGNRISSVAFSPDGKRLVTGSADRTVRVWDLSSVVAVADPKPPVRHEKRDATPQSAETPIDPVKELASFQGTWSWDYSQPWTWPQPIGLGFDGDGRKSEKRWVIEGNRITWVGRDGQRVYVTFTIDPLKTPKQIEFTFLNGPLSGHKSIGIYKSKGDEDYCDLCMTDPGTDAPRPTDFSAGTFKQQSILAIHRVAAPAKPSAAKELKRLQGVWKMTLCDSTLRTFGATQKEIENWQWTIKGDEILWRRGSDEWKLKLEIAPPKSPREMDLTYLTAPFQTDLTYLTGPFKGAKCRGIFGWGGVDRQDLMIAIQDPGSDAPRPTKFHMNSAVKTGLMILSPSQPSDIERENAALQGRWTLRNFDAGNFERNKDPSSWPLPGGKGPDKSGEGSELRWTITGNEISWTSRSGEEIKASFTIDSRQRPKQIDLTFLSGPDKGKTCPGIYQRGDLDENILWLCMTDPGSTMVRPKEFSYGWNEGRSLLSLYPFEPPEPTNAQSSAGSPLKPTPKPSVAPALAAPEKPVATELERFQGIWPMNICDTEDRILYATQEVVRHWRWAIKGNEIVWSRSAGEVWHLTFSVDPTKSPKEIDLIYLDGPFKGKTCLGMYEWGGIHKTSLNISIQDPGAMVARPKSISMTGGGQTSLIFLNPIDHEYDLTLLQGTWSFKVQSDAWPKPIGKANEQRWVVKGKEITWTNLQGDEVKAAFTIDPAKSPKQIDVTFLSGPDKGRKCVGIYDQIALAKKPLRLCMTDPGSKVTRPTEFKYEANTERALIGLDPVVPSVPQTSTVPKSKPNVEPAPAATAQSIAKELKLFQRAWKFDTCWSETWRAETDEVHKWRWTVTGDQITWSGPGGEDWKLSLSIDPSKSPKQIDFKFLDGPHQGEKCVGVYATEGEGQEMWLSLQDPGAKVERPTEFSGAPSDVKNSGRSLIILKPVKPNSREKEVASLQGTWCFDIVQTDAWPVPTGKGPDRTGQGSERIWVIKGNEIIWASPEGEEIRLSFTLDPTQSPKHFDVEFLSGPDKGKKCLGLYGRGGMYGKSLKLCLTDPGSKIARPTAFTYDGFQGRSLISLYPVKPTASPTSTDAKSKPSVEPVPTPSKKPAEKGPLPDDTSSREPLDTSNNPLVLVGHNDWVTSVAFSPDGKRVASSSRDKTIKVWDAVTAKQSFGVKRTSGDVDVKDGQNNFFQNVAFSPDGQWLAGAGSSDKRIFFWVANTGQVATEFYAGGSVMGLAYNRDGTRLASVGSDVKVWDANLDDHRGGHILSLDARDPLSMAFSPDGKRVASADRDHTIRVWNAVTGEEQLAIKHTDELNGVVFSPDGKRLASAGSDGFDVWDATSGKKSFQRNGLGGVSSVAFSPDGRRLASSGWDKLVKLWDASTGQELLAFIGHENRVFGLAFSPDGRRLASCSADRTVRLWSVPPLPKIELRSDTKTELRSGPEPSQETRTDRKVVAGQKTLVLVGHTGWVTGVAFSPDGKRVASGSRDKTIKVWDALSGHELLTLKRTARNTNDGHTSYVQDVAFSPDGKSLASAGGFDSDGLYLWSAVTGKALCRLSTHTNFVMSVAFSSDGKRLASASSDNTVKIWDANPEQQSGGHLLSIDADSPLSVTFSPDGKRLASAGRDKTIKVWNAVTGERLLTAKHSDQLTCAAFSPDGKRLATAGPTGVNVWDSSTGDMLFKLKGLSGVTGVAYSPDGRRLASTGWDKLVKLWDATTGQELLTLKGHGNSVGGLAFSPDGQRLATGSRDWTVRVWDVPSPVVRGALIPAPSPKERLLKAGNDPD